MPRIAGFAIERLGEVSHNGGWNDRKRGQSFGGDTLRRCDLNR